MNRIRTLMLFFYVNFSLSHVDFNLAQKCTAADQEIQLTKRLIQFRESYNKFEFQLLNRKKVLIPRKIHFVWLGSELPDRYKICVNAWKELHPYWQIKIWTDRDLVEFGLENKEFLDMFDNFSYKADLFRYEILYREGGVYINCDFMPLQNLEELHTIVSFYAVLFPGQEIVSNGFIGSVPGHPILRFCIDMLEESLNMAAKDNEIIKIESISGPVYFSKIIDKFFSITTNHYIDRLKAKFVILPGNYIFSLSKSQIEMFWSGEYSLNDLNVLAKQEALAVHLPFFLH